MDRMVEVLLRRILQKYPAGEIRFKGDLDAANEPLKLMEAEEKKRNEARDKGHSKR